MYTSQLRRQSGTDSATRSDNDRQKSPGNKMGTHTPSLPLPDPPERGPEDMTSFDHLTLNGRAHHLVQHFGKPETTLVAGERYITREPGAPAAGRMAPDLLVAFNADPQAYQDDNGYVISEQGKPPDLVMEIASRSTARQDVEEKGQLTPPWASPNTGGSTRPGNSMEPGWPETGWWRAGMNPSPSKPWRTASSRATAECWTFSSGGTTGNWAGMTPRPDST